MKLLCPPQHVSPLLTLRVFVNELGASLLQSRRFSALSATSDKLSHKFTEPYGYPDVPEFRIVKMYTHASLTKMNIYVHLVKSAAD